jgi:WD40 repeat protein
MVVVAGAGVGAGAVLEERIAPSGAAGWLNAIAYSPDGGLLASASDDGFVRWFDAETGALVGSLAAFVGRAQSLAFGPDGASVAAAGRGSSNATAIWDVATGALVREVDVRTDTSIVDLAYAPDGTRLAGVAGDGRLFVWDVAGVEPTAEVQAHRARASAVDFHPTGDLIASGGSWRDGTAVIWSAETLASTMSIQHGGRVSSVAISPDGSQIVSGASDGTVTSWNAITGAKRFSNADAFGAGALAYSPDGTRVLVANYGGVAVLDALTGGDILQLSSAGNLLRSLDVDATGSRVAAGGLRGAMWLWDAVTGNLLHSISAFPSGQVESMAFTPDGSKVVSGVGYISYHDPMPFAVWDSATGAELARRDANAYGVFALAFADGGARMVSGGRSPMLVWDTATWTVTDTIPHDEIVSALVATGDYLIIGGWRSPGIQFLDPATHEVLATVPVASSVFDFHDGSGRVVVANASNVQVWEVKRP